MEDTKTLFYDGIRQLRLVCTGGQAADFMLYLEELKKWNRAYNLTGLKTDRDIVIKHFLDSLLFVKAFDFGKQIVADIGSGAGFPGIPIKIMHPGLTMILVEPTQKKIAFLRHICNKLGLQNIELIDKRVEDLKERKVDVGVTRALFSISDFIKKTDGIMKEQGVLILSKGPKLDEEVKDIEGKNLIIKDLKLPFHDTVRRLVIVRTERK